MRGFCSLELFLCSNTGISHQSSAVLLVTLATTLSCFLSERPLHCTSLRLYTQNLPRRVYIQFLFSKTMYDNIYQTLSPLHLSTLSSLTNIGSSYDTVSIFSKHENPPLQI